MRNFLILISFLFLFSSGQAFAKSEFNKESEELFTLLKEKKFDLLDERMNVLMKSNKLTIGGKDYFTDIINYSLNGFSPMERDQRLLLVSDWIKAKPESVPALLTRGRLYVDYAWEARTSRIGKHVTDENQELFHERLDKAVDDYRKASTLGEHPFMYEGLMWAYIGKRGEIDFPMAQQKYMINGLYKNFDNLFNRAIELDPNYYWAYRAKQNFLFSKWYGSDEETLKYLEYLRGLNVNPVVKTLIADVYIEFARLSKDQKEYLSRPEIWKEITEVYQAVIKQFPKTASARYSYAVAAIKVGKKDIALKYLNEIIALDPETYEAYMELAEIYLSDKDYKKAEEMAKKMLELKSNFSGPYVYMGRIKSELKLFEESINYYDTAVKISPTISYIWRNRCKVLIELNRLDDALNSCNKSIELDPAEKWAYEYRAEIYKLQNKTAEAQKDITAGALLGSDNDPRGAETQYNAGYQLTQSGDLKGAKAYFGKAVELDPDEARYWYAYCATYQRLGELTDNMLKQCDKEIERVMKLERNAPFAATWAKDKAMRPQ